MSREYRDALTKLEDERAVERNTRRFEIEADLDRVYKDPIATLRVKANAEQDTAAALSLQKKRDETAHLVGKKVKREKIIGGPLNYRSERPRETVYGTIEIREPGTPMPQNLGTWNLPRMGALFVRLQKKDGTLGKAVVALWTEIVDGKLALRAGYISDWKIA